MVKIMVKKQYLKFGTNGLKILLSYIFTSVFEAIVCLCLIATVFPRPAEFGSLTLRIFKFPQLATQ